MQVFLNWLSCALDPAAVRATDRVMQAVMAWLENIAVLALVASGLLWAFGPTKWYVEPFPETAPYETFNRLPENNGLKYGTERECREMLSSWRGLGMAVGYECRPIAYPHYLLNLALKRAGAA
ncbi:hypothetical protein M2281_001620 [Mesorhizobium soli]|uniref:hypothetical protein n=1 Tax=Pseudaminobacter soli (ex Li et al. 2025) TaxID=1295366 RepID=UPI00247509A8|nr:hypothetical protein [Mesorhizobium soli]MDH6231048.1 hypothetical protein [Mesorhizobium soli]